MKLTEKQKAFCDYYIETLNATESYKKAYPSCKNDNSARTNASRLLTNANVKTYIDDKLKELEGVDFSSRTPRRSLSNEINKLLEEVLENV